MKDKIDLVEDSLEDQVSAIIGAKVLAANRSGQALEDVAKHLLMDVLGHEWVDDDLEENIIMRMATEVGIEVVGSED